MYSVYKTYWILALLAILMSCSKDPDIDNTVDLDGTEIYDPSLDHPENYLLSKQIATPTPEQLNTPVIITVHGFSASTWEWDEFCEWSKIRGTYLTSQILLGGHGLTYEYFKNASWEDWQSTIIKEYKALDSIGYTNISLVGSSTGAPLILEMIESGKIATCQQPHHIIMIDPIILPSNKSLTLINFVGLFIGYTKTSLDSAENGHYYKYRPKEALAELLDLLEKTRHNLEDGITLPDKMSLHIYKSIKDGSADPVSAVLLYKGVTTSYGKPNVKMVDSNLHVFTYLKGRNSYSANDKALQINIFLEIETTINSSN